MSKKMIDIIGSDKVYTNFLKEHFGERISAGLMSDLQYSYNKLHQFTEEDLKLLHTYATSMADSYAKSTFINVILTILTGMVAFLFKIILERAFYEMEDILWYVSVLAGLVMIIYSFCLIILHRRGIAHLNLAKHMIELVLLEKNRLVGRELQGQIVQRKVSLFSKSISK